MVKTAVMIDSVGYIPKNLREKYHIYLVDTPILFGTETHYEDATWGDDNERFYQDLAKSSVLPTTSQATPGDFMAVLDQVKADGYENVILVTMSSGISGTYQNVRVLAESYEGLNVYVWDSLIATAAEGNQALLAAGLAQKNVPVEEILAQMKIVRDNTDVRLTVDDIAHLQRTGRLSSGAALVGGLLNIKPVLTFIDGKIVAVGKERQMKRAWAATKKAFDDTYLDMPFPVRVTVLDANNSELADRWFDEMQTAYGDNPDVIVKCSIINPLVGVHVGEHAIAMFWQPDWETIVDQTPKSKG